jgi:hypothetical protein
MLSEPLIPVGAGTDVAIATVRQLAEEFTPQTLVAVTQMLPPLVPDVTMIVFEPCPDVIVHPVGTVQV